MAHGVSIEEVPTGVKPAAQVTAGLPVYVGTAPINAGIITNVNKPVLISTLAEWVENFGPIPASSLWDDYTLGEAAYAHFSVYSIAPIVVINVLNPSDGDHTSQLTTEPSTLDADGNTFVEVYGSTTPLYGVIKSTVVVKVAGVTKTLGTDYTLAFDSDGYLVISRVTTGTIAALATLTVSADYFDPAGVTSADIIGGYSAGAYTGLEVVEQVYPALRMVPGFILAPKWSQEPTVAARMATIAHSINGAFRAHALYDLSTDAADIATYAAAGAWKSANGFDAIDGTPFWPLVKSGSDVFHLSTVMACIANVTDHAHSDLPYASPSNQEITATAMVNDAGTEIFLTRPQANILNDQGIGTALNGFYGWKSWGNRTGGYPGTTDVKDAFIAIRRMFNWIENTIILTTDRDVDQPGNKRLIEGVVGTIGSFINGLIAAGALVDGKIEFRSDENPLVDLSNGIIRFHVTLTPPSPAESIEFITEYDPAALAALFA